MRALARMRPFAACMYAALKSMLSSRHGLRPRFPPGLEQQYFMQYTLQSAGGLYAIHLGASMDWAFNDGAPVTLCNRSASCVGLG